MPDDPNMQPGAEIASGAVEDSSEQPGRPGDPGMPDNVPAEAEDIDSELAALVGGAAHDLHSQAIGPIDTHSVRVEVPVPAAVHAKPQPKPGFAVPAPPAVTPQKTTDAVAATKPVAAATRQATQTAVSTAR